MPELTASQTSSPDDQPLGEAGMKALRAERAARRRAEREVATLAAQLKRLQERPQEGRRGPGRA